MNVNAGRPPEAVTSKTTLGANVPRRDDPADFAAVRDIIEVLRPMTDERRARVLMTVATFFGLELETATKRNVRPISPTAKFFDARNKTPHDVFEARSDAPLPEKTLMALEYLNDVRGQARASHDDVATVLREAGVRSSRVRSTLGRLVEKGDVLVRAGRFTLSASGKKALASLKKGG